MRFNPIRDPVFFPGSTGEDQLARKILENSRISFKEVPSTQELSGFSNKHPTLVVNGRPYHGLEEIKHASMNIFSK